jgi:hypothetical protein
MSKDEKLLTVCDQYANQYANREGQHLFPAAPGALRGDGGGALQKPPDRMREPGLLSLGGSNKLWRRQDPIYSE